jgi:hypothetical protein
MNEDSIKEETKTKNTITIKFGWNTTTDKTGKDLRDRDGNVMYDRHDTIALSQIFSAIDVRALPIDQHEDWIHLAKRVKTAWREDANEMELSPGEVSFLRDVGNLKIPTHDTALLLGTFFAETLQSLRKQLK